MTERQRSDVAFADVAERVAPRLFRIGVRMCGSADEAEDLVQDALLQGFRKWHQFEGRSDPATWLYTIAGRLCQRRHRRRAGEPSRMESLSALSPSAEDPMVELPAAGESPLDEHLRKDAERAVSTALAQLPPHVRLPLVLADIAELSTSEVAPDPRVEGGDSEDARASCASEPAPRAPRAPARSPRAASGSRPTGVPRSSAGEAGRHGSPRAVSLFDRRAVRTLPFCVRHARSRTRHVREPGTWSVASSLARVDRAATAEPGGARCPSTPSPSSLIPTRSERVRGAPRVRMAIDCTPVRCAYSSKCLTGNALTSPWRR